jgi:diguanylate cyclase
MALHIEAHAMLSFRNRLLILLIGLVVGAETVTLFTALPQTASNERRRANEALELGAQNAMQQLKYRNELLANSVDVLVKDYGLFEAIDQAIGSQGDSTLASALGNHAARVKADLILALDLDGQLLAQGEGTAEVDVDLVAALRQDLERDTRGARFVQSRAGVYQVFIAPVMAPDEIAHVALGFAVDQKLADDLHELVGADVEVAFLANTASAPLVLASTNAALRMPGHGIHAALPVSPGVVTIGGVEYLATAKPVSAVDSLFNIALLKPMDKVMQPYHELEWILVRIIGLTLVAAIIAGIYLGRTATRPVQRLAAGAARIAAGDYSQPVEASGGQELAHLAESFNSMQIGIAERESRLLHVARHDAATGLPNRLRMEEWLTLRLGSRGNSAIVQLVVTNLPEISATLGFEIAEGLASHMAQQLARWNEGRGIVARFDHATFAVAVELDREAELEAILQQLRECSGAAFTTTGIALQAAVVMGVAVAPRDATTAAEALRCAHAAVESAVLQRVNVAHFAASSDEAQHRRLKLGADLPQALTSGQLYLHYQPKNRLADRRICGVEALVRWKHPGFGNVSPAEFIPIAERTGASGELTRWVLQSALTQLAQWHRDGFALEMAINLSATDILDDNLVRHILEALRHVKVPAGSLTLEITESVLLHEPEAARRNMEMLRVAGVRFSIDDFGTGYSSLSQLRELPADELKIDQSFVRGQLQGAEQQAVLRAIIDMAHGLGLRTVAEGVETDAQWQLLADLGCHHAQGYLISRPVAAAELLPLLQSSGVSRTDIERTASLRVLELRRRES